MKAPIEADLNVVAADAAWLPSGLDPANQQMSFVHVPRPVHANVSFLSQEYLANIAPAVVTLPSEAVQRALPPPAEGLHFIFHSAFCCSTLLARALDIPGVSMGLKEPEVVNQLAALARQGRSAPGQLNLVTRLLGRPFGAGEAVVVKASNVSNLLIDALMTAAPDARALLLYAPLPRFLRSVASRGLWGRTWGRRLFAVLRHDLRVDLGYSETELFEQTDLQVVALAWLLHLRHFADLLQRMPGRLRALDCDSFLANRAATLMRVAELFGLALDPEQCGQLASGTVFSEHSKEIGRQYDTANTAGRAAPSPATDEEIAMVCQWAEAVGRHIGVPLVLPDRHSLLSG